MTLSLMRVLFIMLSGVVGYYVGTLLQNPNLGWMIGCLGGLILIFIEQRLHRVSMRGLSSMVFGLLLGIFMAKLISDVLSLMPLGDFFLSISRVVLTIIFSYFGAVMALRAKDEFNIIVPYIQFKRQDVKYGIVLVDTSAIIDGRISDVYKTNFLFGRLVVPRFVLMELQMLADSMDEMKRQRGRRGMELLKVMQDDAKIDIRVHEDEMLEDEGVDVKLIKLAKLMDGRICTTDFNLSRTATLQGVDVLNIHELAQVVKFVIFTGEELKVKPIKAGKEANQVVAYLEDGTMVVVRDAQGLIGKVICVVVDSVLETQAGKMVFAKVK